MKYLIISFSILINLFSFAQTSEQVKMVEDAKKKVKKTKGEIFPLFELTTIDGEKVNYENTKGKIVLINFWFTRCKPCIMEIPEMNEMVEEFKSENVVFIAPTFDSDELVKKFLQERIFDYQIVPGVKEYCKQMNIYSYPTHFVLNREGTIEKVIIGYSSMTVGALRKSVRKLLKSK